jgi:hypothetical protein
MFSAAPASPPSQPWRDGVGAGAKSNCCPHIIGQVRLWVYHGAVAYARGTGLVRHNHLHSQRLS